MKDQNLFKTAMNFCLARNEKNLKKRLLSEILKEFLDEQ